MTIRVRWPTAQPRFADRYRTYVPIVAAAICPHPPLLVPEVAAGAAGELADLRSACDDAVAGLLTARPGLVVAVGTASHTAWYTPPAYGSLRGFGVPVDVSLGSTAGGPALPIAVESVPPVPLAGGAAPEPSGGEEGPSAGPAPMLPLSLTIGAWLLDRQPSPPGHVLGLAVRADAEPEACAELGAHLAGRREGIALLVLGDGSACRTEKAPGYFDPRAAGYDAAVADALRRPDPDALLALDPALSAQLRVAGRAAWQVLAGAAGGRDWRGTLSYAAAPYGVGYLVAAWRPA